MSDLEYALRDLYRARSQEREPDALLNEVLSIPDAARSTGGWLPRISSWETRSMLSATKSVGAGLVVALFGGLVFSGILALQSGPDQGSAIGPGASVAQSPSSDRGGATPPPCPTEWEPPDRHILWETPSARLEADRFEMRRGDCFWTGVGPVTRLRSDPGDEGYRTLEVEWEEQGATHRFNFYFGADKTHWWVEGGELVDPAAPDEDQLLRTPRGETFEGDVHLVTSDPEVDEPRLDIRIEGLRLTAFAPGTGPAPLTDCRFVRQQRRADVRRSLARAGITEMSPTEAERLLRDRGLCFTFRYDYPIIGSDVGYSERWCTAPRTGRVADTRFLSDGELIVFVGDRTAREEREQPPEGWNCPSDALGAPDASERPGASRSSEAASARSQSSGRAPRSATTAIR